MHSGGMKRLNRQKPLGFRSKIICLDKLILKEERDDYLKPY